MNNLKKRKTNHPPQIAKRKVNARRKRALRRIENVLSDPPSQYLTKYQASDEGRKQLAKEAEVLRSRIR